MPTTALEAVMPSRVPTLGIDHGLGRSDARFISATSTLEMMFATQYLIWLATRPYGRCEAKLWELLHMVCGSRKPFAALHEAIL